MSVHITTGPSQLAVNPTRIVDMPQGEYSLTSPSSLFTKSSDKLFISSYIDQCTDWFGVTCIIYHGKDDRWYVVLNKGFTRDNQIRIRPEKSGRPADDLELLSPWSFFWRGLMFKWFGKSLIKGKDEKVSWHR